MQWQSHVERLRGHVLNVIVTSAHCRACDVIVSSSMERPWMGWRLKLNTDKTQFIWLGTPHQVSKLTRDTVTIRGIPIRVYWSYVPRRSTWQCTDLWTSYPPSVRQMFLPFAIDEDRSEVTNSGGCQDDGACIYYQSHRLLYNSVMHGASTVHIRPLQNVLNAAARLILCKRKYDQVRRSLYLYLILWPHHCCNTWVSE